MRLDFLNLTRTQIDPGIFDPVICAVSRDRHYFYKNSVCPNTTISLVIIGSRRMRKLNHSYLKKDEPTDVLAFAINDPAVLGEIFICPSMAQGYSSKQKALQFLLIHGLLHILGFTHNTEKDYAQMREQENKIFRRCS